MLLVLTNVQHIFPTLLLSISEIPEIPIEEFLFIHTLNIEHELQHETQFVKLFFSRILECCTDCCDREHILLHIETMTGDIYTRVCAIFFVRFYVVMANRGDISGLNIENPIRKGFLFLMRCQRHSCLVIA